MRERILLAAKFARGHTIGFLAGSFLSARLWKDTMPDYAWGWIPLCVLYVAASWWMSYYQAGAILKRTDAS